MDELKCRVLLGILRKESLQEMADFLQRSVSFIHDTVVWLRDQGYIKPWQPKKARSKELTEIGRQVVAAAYGQEALKVQDELDRR
jgi:predicted methyltransferase